MNPLIKKEIRLLLPAWVVAMLLAIVSLPNPFWTRWFTGAPHIGVPLGFILGFLFLSIQSFGQELSSGTFASLLAQPMERQRVWRIKTSMLALAFVSVLFVWAVPREFYSLVQIEENRFWYYPFDLHRNLLFFAVAIFSGALWTTLLLRQILGAFWLTLLVPIAIVYPTGLISDHFNWPVAVGDTIANGILIAYSIAGFFWARWMFLGAQDTQWTGGNVFFPWRRKSAEQAASSFIIGPFRNRFLSLIWKEIRLHEINLFIAVILFFINLAAVVLRPFVSNADYKTALEFAWALWLLMPLLIGCAAVAEERRLGVMESQLCQSVSRRAQFFIKFSFGLLLSLLLGAVMPTVIERTATFSLTTWFNYWIFFAAAAWFGVSFYASTLSRSTVQAIGQAIAIPAVATVCLAAFFRFIFQVELQSYQDRYEAAGRVICLIYFGIPAFVVVLIQLMFWNFKWFHENWKLWRNNIATLLISFFAIYYVLTPAIYYRSWELLAPGPFHGPARLNPEKPAKFFSKWGPWGQLVAVLPDGRIWAENMEGKTINAGNIMPDGWGRWFPNLQTQRFIGTSDGTNVSASPEFILSIHSDGTLWAMPLHKGREEMQQIGPDTNWQKVATTRWGSFLLLKKDGTLWNYRPFNYSRKALRTHLPTRLSAESNWVDIVSFALGPDLVKKSDGSLWKWEAGKVGGGFYGSGTSYYGDLVEQTNVDREWVSYVNGGLASSGVKTNGTLWLFYRPPDKWAGEGIPAFEKKLQLGSDSNWKEVTFSDSDSLIILRNDGTLWKWELWKRAPFQSGNVTWSALKPEPFHPIQIGRDSDWITLESGLALASDGSIWAFDQPSDRFWLARSRRPAYMGNIFQSSSDGP